uniref:Uncharacterized protein n=1 Tax=Romanomermis culicivorax TaxID=13658 RepID=A0A915L8D2_ROMCU
MVPVSHMAMAQRIMLTDDLIRRWKNRPLKSHNFRCRNKQVFIDVGKNHEISEEKNRKKTLNEGQRFYEKTHP